MTTDYELAVTLDPRKALRFEDAVATLRNIYIILQDLERNVRQTQEPTADWGVGDHPQMRFVAHVNGVDATTLRRIVTVAQDGLQRATVAAQRQAPVDWPPEFGRLARESTESIVRLLESLDSTILIEATGAEQVELSLEPPNERKRAMHSSVDGILEWLGKRGEHTTYVGLREFRTGNYVRCYLNRDRWREEISRRTLWEKHVIIYGVVTYNQDGIPLSIRDVTDIQERSGSANLSQLEGQHPDLTGRFSTAGFIRRLRGHDA